MKSLKDYLKDNSRTIDEAFERCKYKHKAHCFLKVGIDKLKDQLGDGTIATYEIDHSNENLIVNFFHGNQYIGYIRLN